MHNSPAIAMSFRIGWMSSLLPTSTRLASCSSPQVRARESVAHSFDYRDTSRGRLDPDLAMHFLSHRHSDSPWVIDPAVTGASFRDFLVAVVGM
jgi:hypothetical protein